VTQFPSGFTTPLSEAVSIEASTSEPQSALGFTASVSSSSVVADVAPPVDTTTNTADNDNDGHNILSASNGAKARFPSSKMRGPLLPEPTGESSVQNSSKPYFRQQSAPPVAYSSNLSENLYEKLFVDDMNNAALVKSSLPDLKISGQLPHACIAARSSGSPETVGSNDTSVLETLSPVIPRRKASDRKLRPRCER